MRIYLIRHARSTANAMKVWTGQSDAGLSQEGEAELREICRRFEYPRCDLYFSSPLLRCTESMRIIYGRGADCELAELAECDMGGLAGTRYTSLDDDPNYLTWIGNPDKTPPWKGESFGAFCRRAERGFVRMIEICRERGARSAAAVTHGDVMRAVLRRFADSAVAHGEWKIPNCGLYTLECDEKGAARECGRLPEFLFGPGK